MLMAASLTVIALPAHAQADLDRIGQCMRGNIPNSLRVQNVELTAVDAAGHEQTLRGSLAVESHDGATHLLWSLSAPADLAGSAMLVRKDDGGSQTWVYLPALGQARKVEQADREGRMFGTDISYGDAGRIVSTFADGALTLLGADRFEDRPVWKMAATAAPDSGAKFERIDLLIDQQTCVVLRADMLQDDVARKRWTVPANALVQSGHYWFAAAGTMRDLQGNTETRARFWPLVTDRPLPRTLFDPRSFFQSH